MPALNRAENAVNDLLLSLGTRSSLAEDYVFVAIDEASLVLDSLEDEELAGSPELMAMLDGFPWPRDVIAAAARKLIGAGARVVAIDLIFPRKREGDDVLASLLREYPDRIVLGANFSHHLAADGASHWQLSMPSESLLPPEEAADGQIGFVNFWPDAADDLIRQVRYEASLEALEGFPGGEPLPAFSAAVVRQARGLPQELPEGTFQAFVPSREEGLELVPFYSLFVPEMWQRNLRNGEIFRDKLVFIGPEAERLQDFHSLPVVGRIPGAVVHMHATEALRAEGFYKMLPPIGNFLLLLLASASAFLIVWKFRRASVQFALVLLVGGFWLLFSWALLRFTSFLPEALEIASGAFFTGFIGLAVSFTIEQREAVRMRSMLDRYVSRNVVSEILERPDTFLAAIGGSRTEVAVLFSDVRGFTSFSESGDPVDVVRQLNAYLEEMVKIIFAERGTVDKFIGDGIMAIWGNILSAGPSGDCSRAVRAALRMREAVSSLNKRWAEEGDKEFRIGIGINFGPVVFGNIGSDEKMDLTVIGDAVNLAARIESATKKYKVDLLVSQSTASHLPEEFILVPIDRARVVGRRLPVDLFAVEGTGEPPAWLEAHRAAIEAFRDGSFEIALGQFEALDLPEQYAAVRELYIQRCRDFTDSAPDNWDGAVSLDSK